MKNHRWLITSSLFVAIAIALLFIFSNSAQALMLKMSLEELTSGAESVVVGTVVSSTSYWNADQTNIYTEVVISVEDRLKGPAGNNTITIIVPGGTAGETTEWVEDTPVFVVGEQVGLFVKDVDSTRLAQMGRALWHNSLPPTRPRKFTGTFKGSCRSQRASLVLVTKCLWINLSKM